ncbi:MAG UNVERIFIED_CONTAM: hypothetical protein LVQ98_01540 [Rickettsiaceae bacterium]|jgi:hypothetical protein
MATSFVQLGKGVTFTGDIYSSNNGQGVIKINGNSSIVGSLEANGVSIDAVNFLGDYTLDIESDGR